MMTDDGSEGRESEARESAPHHPGVLYYIIVVSLVAVVALVAVWAARRGTSEGVAALFGLGIAVTAASLAAWRYLDATIPARNRVIAACAPSAAVILAGLVGMIVATDRRAFAWLVVAGAAGGLITATTVQWWNPKPREAAAGSFPELSLHTGQGTDPRPEEATLDLLRRLHPFLVKTAAVHRQRARNWFRAYVAIAFVAAVGAGVAGVTVAGGGRTDEVWSYIAAGLALVGAGATALSSGLNPGHEWRAAHDLANSCESLAREVVAMAEIDMHRYAGVRPPLDRAAVQHVLDRLDVVVGAVGEAPSFWTSHFSEMPEDPATSRRQTFPGNSR